MKISGYYLQRVQFNREVVFFTSPQKILMHVAWAPLFLLSQGLYPEDLTPVLLSLGECSHSLLRGGGREEQGTSGNAVLPTPGFWHPSYMAHKGTACKSYLPLVIRPKHLAAQKPKFLFSFNRCILSTYFVSKHYARHWRHSSEQSGKDPCPVELILPARQAIHK